MMNIDEPSKKNLQDLDLASRLLIDALTLANSGWYQEITKGHAVWELERLGEFSWEFAWILQGFWWDLRNGILQWFSGLFSNLSPNLLNKSLFIFQLGDWYPNYSHSPAIAFFIFIRGKRGWAGNTVGSGRLCGGAHQSRYLSQQRPAFFFAQCNGDLWLTWLSIIATTTTREK